MRVVALAALVLGLAASAAAAGSASACRLASVAEASAALRSPVDGRTEQDHRTGALSELTCAYGHAGGVVATVTTYRLAYAGFLRTAALEPTPVVRVRGLGVAAFAFGPVEKTLFTWSHGEALMIDAPGFADQVAAERRLAKTLLSRL